MKVLKSKAVNLIIAFLLLFILDNFCYSATADLIYESHTPYPGVKPGDWIEYNMTSIPASEDYPIKTRREILKVNGTVLTINITFWYGNGTITNRVGEGDVYDGSGYCFLFFIPANLAKGDIVTRANFANIMIDDELERNYLGNSRVVLYADFSGRGYNGTVYWDKIKGVALELNLTQGTNSYLFLISATNMFSSNESDNGTLIYLILYLASFLVLVVGGSLYYLLVVEKGRVGGRRKSRKFGKIKLNMYRYKYLPFYSLCARLFPRKHPNKHEKTATGKLTITTLE